MKSYAFLFWGYTVVWTGLAVYLVALGVRISRLAKQARSIESRLERGGPVNDR